MRAFPRLSSQDRTTTPRRCPRASEGPALQQPPPESPSLVEKRDAENILGTHKRTSFHPRAGKGAKLVDAEGKVYWDLLAGIAVNALGHRHPRLVKALREEANRLLHVSNLFYLSLIHISEPTRPY